MKRGSELKRTGFKQHARPDRVKPVHKPLERQPNYARPADEDVCAMPKEGAIQHQHYMRLVRLFPCAHCGLAGHTQFCHSDQGKGGAIKSDCREGWPGCGPRPGIPGCHHLIGTQRIYPKAERRERERAMAAATRKKIFDLGLWPEDLEHYE